MKKTTPQLDAEALYKTLTAQIQDATGRVGSQGDTTTASRRTVTCGGTAVDANHGYVSGAIEVNQATVASCTVISAGVGEDITDGNFSRVSS